MKALVKLNDGTTQTVSFVGKRPEILMVEKGVGAVMCYFSHTDGDGIPVYFEEDNGPEAA